MVLQRLVFQAKYGKADELVSVLKRGDEILGKYGYSSGRVLTDLTGKMFTVVWESEWESMGAFEALRGKLFAAPEFGPWFAEMQALVESGSREFYNLE